MFLTITMVHISCLTPKLLFFEDHKTSPCTDDAVSPLSLRNQAWSPRAFPTRPSSLCREHIFSGPRLCPGPQLWSKLLKLTPLMCLRPCTPQYPLWGEIYTTYRYYALAWILLVRRNRFVRAPLYFGTHSYCSCFCCLRNSIIFLRRI